MKPLSESQPWLRFVGYNLLAVIGLLLYRHLPMWWNLLAIPIVIWGYMSIGRAGQ